MGQNLINLTLDHNQLASIDRALTVLEGAVTAHNTLNRTRSEATRAPYWPATACRTARHRCTFA